MEIIPLCFGAWAAYLRQAGVDQDALVGQAHERCAALRAARIRGADWTACLSAAWCQGRLVLHQPQH